MNTPENADIVKETRLAFDRSLGINSRYMTETERNTEGIGFVMRPDGTGRLVRRDTNGLFDTQKNVILYFDPKKAGRYGAYSLKLAGRIPSGYVHNIHDPGSPVKGNFKKQTEILQFKRWFGDSKGVDKDGKPLVVYHGTDWDMMNEPAGKAVFDQGKIGQNFFQSLGGFFFTSRRETTANYGESVEAFYLSMKNPLIVQPPVMRSAIEYFDMERGNLVREAEARGYDGIIVDGMNYDIPKYRQKLFVVFSPNQIKSASQNIGTFDIRNPDVRYSMKQENVNLKKGKSWFAAFGVQSPGAHEIQLHSPYTIIVDSTEVKPDSGKKSEKKPDSVFVPGLEQSKRHEDDLLSPKMSIDPVSRKKETGGSMKIKM